ncbi:MAG: flagellar hook-length control protein FliK [Aquamicrobium sp.]|nr:flagellar hook-length control protein FliK [Aquamicrobium sp.]
MMPNVTLGGNPAGLQQKGERNAKSGEADGAHFADALSGRSGDRKATRSGAEDRLMETSPDWKIDRYAALFRLEKTAEPKPLADGVGFDDLLAEQETADDLPASTTEKTEASSGDTDAESEVPADEQTDADTDEAVVTPVTGKANAIDADAALASRPTSVGNEQSDRSADRANLNADGEQDTSKATARGNTADADPDPQARTTIQPEQPNSARSQAAHVSAAERTTVPPAPVDGRQPTRTRTDASTPVNASAADKSAPATQPSTNAQPEATNRPAVATPNPPPGETSRFVSAKDGSFARDTSPNMPAKADRVSAKVNVLNFTAAPAPAQAAPPVLSTTATGLVAAIEAEGTWRTAAPDPAISAAPRGTSAPGGVNTLRIQLQPVELGMVTARLVASGSQLSIEIQVESNDARQRLANDSEVIVKALRAIGYDIDKVTIQQGPQNGQSAAQQGASGRNDQMQPDQQGDRNARGRGDQGAAGRDGGGARNGAGETMADRSGGSRYI